MKILKNLTVFVLCFFTTQIMAYDATLSAGNICEFVGKIQTDDQGSKNFCNFSPYLSFSVDYNPRTSLVLSPELGFSFPQTGRDKYINKMSFFFLANAKYKMDSFHFIGGMGLYLTRIYSSGGEEDLNNGNSVSSFPLADGAVYTRNLVLNTGVGFTFNQTLSADIHTLVFNLLSSEERAYSILINGTYHFGEF